MKDAEITWKWRNDPDVSNYYSGHPFPVSPEMERKWYEKILYSNIPSTYLGIELTEGDTLIGIIGLDDISFITRSARFSILIGDPGKRGKGYAKESTLAMLRFGFHDLGMNRVSLTVREDNLPALKLYEECGFTREGVLRESTFKKDKYINELVMSILKREFKSHPES